MWPGSGLNASLEKIPESSRQNGSTQSHFLEVTRHGGEGSHIPTWTWAPQVGFSHGRDWSQPSGARQGSWNPTGIRITGRTSLKCTPRPPKHEPGGQGGERECVSNYTLGRLLRLCRVATGITAPPHRPIFQSLDEETGLRVSGWPACVHTACGVRGPLTLGSFQAMSPLTVSFVFEETRLSLCRSKHSDVQCPHPSRALRAQGTGDSTAAQLHAREGTGGTSAVLGGAGALGCLLLHQVSKSHLSPATPEP